MIGRRHLLALGGCTLIFLAGLLAGWMLAGGSRAPGRYLFTGSGLPVARGSVVTLHDYFLEGERACTRFLAALPDGERDAWAEVDRIGRAAVVRLRAITHRQGEEVRSSLGTGVLVDPGDQVLTVGHIAADSSVVEFLLHRADGGSLAVKDRRDHDSRFRQADDDWAVLELTRKEAGPHPVPGLARPGDLVLIVGYPAGLGRDAEGRILQDAQPERMGELALEPLRILARVVDVAPLRMEPVAGAVPLGGMSGAPLFNRTGAVVGLFAAVDRSPGPGRTRILYRATAVRAAARPGDGSGPNAQASESVWSRRSSTTGTAWSMNSFRGKAPLSPPS